MPIIDQVELHFLRQVQPVDTVFCYVDDEPGFAKSFLQELSGLGFIFNDQNSHTELCRSAYGE